MFQIHLFGGLDIVAPEGGPVGLSSRSCATLLAFLALNHGRRFPRRRLAGTLWPERGDRAAQKKLRNCLWRLGRELPDGREPVIVDGGRIGLDPAVWVDVEDFRIALADPGPSGDGRLPIEQVALMEQALTLYRGDVLEGLDDHWVAGPRETYRLLHQSALERLVVHYRATGEARRAIARGRELIRRNPFLEHVHRELMHCYWMLGDRPMAVRQYRACAQILRAELDLEPMAETRLLIERIRAGDAPIEARDASPGPRSGGRRRSGAGRRGLDTPGH